MLESIQLSLVALRRFFFGTKKLSSRFSSFWNSYVWHTGQIFRQRVKYEKTYLTHLLSKSTHQHDFAQLCAIRESGMRQDNNKM